MKVVIIGNGISGITAARYIRKLSDFEILVVSGETDYFFSRTALMYVYMGHMRFKDIKPYEDWFWKKNRIDLLRDWISDIDTKKKQLIRSNGLRINYDKLLLACGSKPNKFNWPGQDLAGVQTLYSCQDLDMLEQNTSRKVEKAVVVGGGLTGIELVEMLHSRGIETCMLVRESSYMNNVLPKGESEIISRHIKEYGIDLRLSTELSEAVADENGRVKAVITDQNEIIPCQLLGLTTGVSPNIDWLEGTPVETKTGILVNKAFETNLKDIYAAGDCVEFRDPSEGRSAIEQVWYTGKMHGKIVAKNICNSNMKIEYDPGPWFNSAKFFDIEYQTYGRVLPENKENEDSIYWEHKDGRKCIHIVYDKNDMTFKGINLLGIRYDHEVIDAWLREERKLEYVIESLHLANFDPQLCKRFEKYVVMEYNKRSGKNIKLRNRRRDKILSSSHGNERSE